VSPIKKCEYEQFLENYYQDSFDKTLDIISRLQDVDAKIVRKFYDYQWLKRDEDMVHQAKAAKDHKSVMLDPSRITAIFERIGNTKRAK